MKVVPIAWTVIDPYAMTEVTPYSPHDPEEMPGDELAEFAGRNCYLSWQRPNPKTATNEGYLANILAQGHESVLEHGSVTFFAAEVSRSLTHELVRHRHLSFSELSQRFVNMEDASCVVPEALDQLLDLDNQGITWAQTLGNIGELEDDIESVYADIADKLKRAGLSRKEAREAARCVMPNGLETQIVVSGNLRAWRDVIKRRHHVAADKEIQRFAGKVLRHLRGITPNSVQDIPEEPYGSE